MYVKLEKNGDTKLCGVINTPKGRDAIQRDLVRLSSGSRRTSLMRFIKAKWRSCSWVMEIPPTNTSWGVKGLSACALAEESHVPTA